MKQRQTELDILRFCALLCVVGLHADSGVWGAVPMFSGNWYVITLLRFTWAVPAFVMISGRFFLDPQKQIPVKMLYNRYILRIAVAYLVWSVIYTVYFYGTGMLKGLNFKGLLCQVVEGPVHMWFLWMIMGLYMLTPLLRKITEDQKLTRYFLVLWFGMQIADSFLTELPVVGNLTQTVLTKLHLQFLLGFSGYFVLGYELQRWQPTQKQEFTVYGLGLVSAVLSRLGNLWITFRTGQISEFFTMYLSPSMILTASAFYLFFVKRVSHISWKPGIEKFLARLTRYGMGAYLAHFLILKLIFRGPVYEVTASYPIVALPAVTLAVTALSFLLSAVLQHIPKIGRFLA